jgi:DNA-binding transcriptional ArsR family regulator
MAPSLQEFKADFFRALAHPTRIRILEALGEGERTVQELQQILGLEQPLVSQQLAVLRGRHVVSAQKAGATVKYALGDPLIRDLLGVAREIFNHRLAQTQTLLRELKRERRK